MDFLYNHKQLPKENRELMNILICGKNLQTKTAYIMTPVRANLITVHYIIEQATGHESNWKKSFECSSDLMLTIAGVWLKYNVSLLRHFLDRI